MFNSKKSAWVVSILLAVILSYSPVFGEKAQQSAMGGGFGNLLSGETSTEKDLGINRDAIPGFSTSSTNIPITNASQIVGLYVLQDFTVTYDSGAVMEGRNYNFSGDMAITQNSTSWQRLAISGIPQIVVSASFTINGNQLIAYNDLIQATSVLNLTWDGTYLTTQGYFNDPIDPFTEVDVWRRVLSQPSDQDADGVIDTWDTCPGTNSSCVDKSGCGCIRFKPAVNPAVQMLLLDKE